MIPPNPCPEVTVVIPTFNGQRYLGKVLAGLCRQSVAPSRFEVVVVDNNSTINLFDGPGTAAAIATLRQMGISFRCVIESRQGLSNARTAGVQAARAPVVCFLDDDNQPETDYLAAGLTAMNDPAVGLLISRVYPAFEEEPSRAVRRRQHLLAINFHLGSEPIRWPAGTDTSPSLGAGMWIKTVVFLSILAKSQANLLPDRVGQTLTSGGDIEIGILVGLLGHDRLYVPELIIHHQIPTHRLKRAYLIRLIRGIVRGEATLNEKYFGRRERLHQRVGRLVSALILGGPIALLRGDTWNEYCFIVAAALARYQGPLMKSTVTRPTLLRD